MSTFQDPTPTSPEIAYLWLRREISSHPWDQDAFFTENAIAEAAGVSRTPVRDALLRLEAAGLLRRVPHKGAY
ncbi:GntR family transcriptional regulator, partial [Paraburkholderia sp. SIMBA_030]